MARRKKYPKLPNGYGSIKKLSGNRRNPYAVYPPATDNDIVAPGQYKLQKAICYTDDWYKGFAVLTAYHAGNYYPGYERTLNEIEGTSTNQMLADYNQAFRPSETEEKKPTFAEVYKRYFKFKYEDSGKTYSAQAPKSTRAAFRNCSVLHDRIFEELRHDDLQNAIDSCKLKHASLELILSLFHQMYAYAEIYELVDKDYSKHVKIKIQDDDEHGEPFTNDELKILWDNKDNETVELILILCYSGFRIGAIKGLNVNLKDKCFQGGIKTDAGKNRIVPIHSGIYDLVKKRIQRDSTLLTKSDTNYRNDMYAILSELKITRHTPHDCRHTFSKLCDDYDVNEREKKRMLGHKFADVTNSVYGHDDLDRARREIEKIKICC